MSPRRCCSRPSWRGLTPPFTCRNRSSYRRPLRSNLGPGTPSDSDAPSSSTRSLPILPRQPRERLCELLNACDIALISFVPGMAGISVPSRMYNVMAAGKPIVALCDSDSEVSHVIREENIGWVLRSDQPSALPQVLLDALADREQLALMGYRARQAATRKYTREITLDGYVFVLGRVLSRLTT